MAEEILLLTINGILEDLFIQGSLVVYSLALAYGVINYK